MQGLSLLTESPVKCLFIQVQPKAVVGYTGFTPDQMLVLSRLTKLSKLSLQLSSKEGLPTGLIYILCKFKALRYITLSWGKCFPMNRTTIPRFMDFIHSNILIYNVNLCLQYSCRHHPDIISDILSQY